MVKFIVGAKLPLSIVNNNYFTIFMKEYLQPIYVRISRNSLYFDTIYYFIKTERQLIHDLYKYSGVISFTSNL